MTFARDVSSGGFWLGNQEESTGEKLQENGERVREEWNILRPEGVRVATHSPYHPVHRQFFSEEEEQMEALLIKVIHTILTGFPRFFDCPKEHFTHNINNELARKYPHFSGKAAFERPEDCVEFLRRRKFLFEKHPQDNYHRNTGFGYRKTVGEIVRFIHEKTSFNGLCSLKDLIYFCQYAHMSNVPVEETVRAIVYGYPEFFWTNTEFSDVLVALTQLAFEIPSLWSENVLPDRPTEPYSDKSQTEVFLTEVIWSCYGYRGKVMKARILDGFYTGCVIHFFEKYPEDLSKITKVIPVGSMAIFFAHMVGGYSYQFYGIRAVPVPSECFDLVNRRRLEMVARGFLGAEEATAHPSTSAPLVHHHVEYAPLNDLIAAENSLINFVDEILGEVRMNEDRFVEVLLDSSHSLNYEHFFRDPREAWEFVRERPHLYCFNGDASWALFHVERKAYNALFEYLDNNGNEGTFAGIKNTMRTVRCRKSVKTLSNTLGSILSKTHDCWRTSYYSLTAYFDKEHHILLPGYPKVLPPSSIDDCFYSPPFSPQSLE